MSLKVLLTVLWASYLGWLCPPFNFPLGIATPTFHAMQTASGKIVLIYSECVSSSILQRGSARRGVCTRVPCTVLSGLAWRGEVLQKFSTVDSGHTSSFFRHSSYVSQTTTSSLIFLVFRYLLSGNLASPHVK